MSDFIGADTYAIVSYRDPKYLLDLAGGNKADGTQHFVYAGVGKSGKDEYLILNVASGTYLTGGQNSKSDEYLVGSSASPKEDRVRWSVIPLRNGTGAYWHVPSPIAPITDKNLSLSVKSGEMKNKNTIKLFKGASMNANDGSMWYLRLADGAYSPVCPDVGKAPTNENSKV
ncbi:hypothetical protein Q7P36_010275 [Cladosporium allicinum]